MFLLTAEQMGKVEKEIITGNGVNSLILMENAALGICKHVFSFLEENDFHRVLIVCGKGNNGGDGLCLARQLVIRGIKPKVIYLGEKSKTSGDALTNLQIVQKLGISIDFVKNEADVIELIPSFSETDLIVDAIFGIGINSDVRGICKVVIGLINESSAYKISVDVPSGVNPDNGKVMGDAVNANLTVVLGFHKLGLYLYPSCKYCGKVVLENIGYPVAGFEGDVTFLSTDEAKILLPKREIRSNKGTYGKVAVIGGCDEMPGAPLLSSLASYMVGSGLVKVFSTKQAVSAMQKLNISAIYGILPDDNGFLSSESFEALNNELVDFSAIVLGPGLGRNECVTSFVEKIIKNTTCPLVLDADALFHISKNLKILKKHKGNIVLTPHPLEMSKLNGKSVKETLDALLETAREFSNSFGVTTLLKDSHTVVASPNGKVCINLTGNSALSKGGTGDVLSGVIASFLGQGLNPFDATMLGAYVHGLAGEEASKELSEYSVSALDVSKYISKVMNALSK